VDIKHDINKGYTLIELIITIMLTAIIFSVVGIFLAKPIQVYVDIAKRAELVDIADLALRRIERDIHQSLPNSIRVKSVNGKQAIEMVNTVAGMRYRIMSPGSDTAILNFSAADTAFNVFGQFPAALLGNNNYRLVIYNTGDNGISSDDPIAGTNVYATNVAIGPNPPAGTHVITPVATIVALSNIGNEGHIDLNPGFQFALASPQQRLYLVDSPVSYICDPTSTTLTRFNGYTITSVQPVDTTIAPLNSAQSHLIANKITACSLQYQPGTSQRGGIVTIELTVTNGPEQIRLLQQVHVDNVP
jgi:MSHA biogenesis protein MshO